jgi:hypothetical protein
MSTASESVAGAAPNGSATPAAAPATTTPWDGLPEEDRGWVSTKGYPDVGSVVKAARGLEKLLGGPRERLLRLPEKDDDPAWGEIHGKLGRPENPDEYGIEGADPELLAKVHEAGLSKRQVSALSGFLSQRAQAASEKAEAEYEAQAEADDKKLQQEWGQEYQGKLRMASAAAQRIRVGLGMEPAEWGEVATKLNRALGVETAVKIFALIGRGLGEHKFVSGEKESGFGDSVAEARAKLEALRADPEQMKAKQSENKAVRMAAVNKEIALEEIIAAGA